MGFGDPQTQGGARSALALGWLVDGPLALSGEYVRFTIKELREPFFAESESFQLGIFWRDAADFVTPAGVYAIGRKLPRETPNDGNISVYFGKGVAEGE